MLIGKSKIVLLLIFVSLPSVAVERVAYYKNLFGHVHKNMSKYSASLTTITCGHPLKILKGSEDTPGWNKVKASGVEGFIDENFVLAERPSCMGEKYPRFFSSLNLDLSEMYFWGRLYDHYVQGKSDFK